MATPTELAGEAVAHGGSVFPPLDTTTYLSQLIWLAITFGVLYQVMRRVIVPRLAGVAETREVTIARDLDVAAEAKARSQEASAAYDAALADAKAKAQALAQSTREAMAAEADAKRRALEAELGQRLAAAEETIAARKREAMANVSAIAEEAAAAILERLTGSAPAPGAVAAAMRDARG